MKTLMLLGGMIGFVIGLSLGFVQQSGWPSIIWRSCIASFASGCLLRWWGRVWMQGLHEVNQVRISEQNKKQAPSA